MLHLLQYLQVLTVSEHRTRGSFLIQTCLVRLISPAVGQKYKPLVLFPSLQVSSTLFTTLNIVLFPPLQSPWSSVTQGPF